jgi:hypothetical protein
MSVVTWTPRKSRLSQLVDSPGGISVGAALARAREHLAALEPRSLEVVGAHVASLRALEPPATEIEIASRLEAAYQAASGVIDAAGPFERHDLCAAATSLCDVIDATPPDTMIDWRIIQVHARALELMLALPTEAVVEREKVLDGLADVRALKVHSGD